MADKQSFRTFYWKRWHSLSGMFIVGFFVIMHLYTNSFAGMGESAYNDAIKRSMENPWQLALEIIFLYIPLLFHLALGLTFIFKAKYNTIRYGYLDNWRFFLQRMSGLGLALFIGAHFFKTRIGYWLHGTPKEGWYAHMHEAFTSEWFVIPIYVLGILGVMFHLGNGLWTFTNTMGWTKGVESQRKMKIYSIIFMLVIAVMGFYPLYMLTTGK